MMRPQEAVGAVPQQGVNPMARQAPQPAPAAAQPPAPGGQQLAPDQVEALRKDPEIVAAVAQFAGRPVPMESIPDNLLMEIAGMVDKLGVEGAVHEFKTKVPPEVQQQLVAGLQG
jgi:hypothetical protein